MNLTKSIEIGNILQMPSHFESAKMKYYSRIMIKINQKKVLLLLVLSVINN